MKNITKETIKEDYALINELFEKYCNAIYESQEGQPAHYDNQSKLVKLTIGDIRTGLYIASNALVKLCNIEIIED